MGERNGEREEASELSGIQFCRRKYAQQIQFSHRYILARSSTRLVTQGQFSCRPTLRTRCRCRNTRPQTKFNSFHNLLVLHYVIQQHSPRLHVIKANIKREKIEMFAHFDLTPCVARRNQIWRFVLIQSGAATTTNGIAMKKDRRGTTGILPAKRGAEFDESLPLVLVQIFPRPKAEPKKCDEDEMMMANY